MNEELGIKKGDKKVESHQIAAEIQGLILKFGIQASFYAVFTAQSPKLAICFKTPSDEFTIT